MTSEYHTIAFYNLENLFDTFDDKFTHDNDFLPRSEKNWTEKRYRKKVRKLGYAISNIGVKTSKKLPAIVGLAEVENKLVIDDLLNSKFLKDKSFDYVHYDSPDERGIDVALIYDTSVFEVINSEVFPLDLFDEDGSRDYTRDILLVEGKLNNERLFFIVNHWPSRRQGVEESEPSRLHASDKALEVISKVKNEHQNPKIIIMGDFNDGPFNKSIKQLLNSEDLFNPMEKLKSFFRGSLSHRRQWNLFDQILFTTNFFEYQKGEHSFSKADIFDEAFLRQYKGKYKGNPFRTFVGRKYKGGYSDHFPVYIHLKRS
jgi:predicted extracellular nuclease